MEPDLVWWRLTRSIGSSQLATRCLEVVITANGHCQLLYHLPLNGQAAHRMGELTLAGLREALGAILMTRIALPVFPELFVIPVSRFTQTGGGCPDIESRVGGELMLDLNGEEADWLIRALGAAWYKLLRLRIYTWFSRPLRRTLDLLDLFRLF